MFEFIAISFLFFKNAGQGYLQLEEEFVVGHQTKLNLEIKPRSKNGVILYAKSSNSSLKDFLLLELVNGSLKATVNNGESEMVAEIDLPNDESCDGTWHQVQLIKMANLAILYLDEQSSGPTIQRESAGSDLITDTNILYVGGYPNELKAKKPYLENAVSYSGCIRSLKKAIKDNEVQERTLDLTRVIKNGKIDLESCPTT